MPHEILTQCSWWLQPCKSQAAAGAWGFFPETWEKRPSSRQVCAFCWRAVSPGEDIKRKVVASKSIEDTESEEWLRVVLPFRRTLTSWSSRVKKNLKSPTKGSAMFCTCRGKLQATGRADWPAGKQSCRKRSLLVLDRCVYIWVFFWKAASYGSG